MHTIVDVGSNTVRMNVYDVKDGKLKLLFSKKETVGLASYVRGQYMSAAGIEKVISVLEEFWGYRIVMTYLQLKIVSIWPLSCNVIRFIV